MAPLYIKAHDTEPLEATLSDRNGPVPLSTAPAVQFAMKLPGGAVIGGACVVVDNGTLPLRGKVTYPWAPGQTATPGIYRAEFQVTFADGSIKTFPNKGYESIIIREDIVP